VTDAAGQLFAAASGHPETSPPVVFLHGFGGSADVWAEIAPRIAERDPTLCYDLPGHHRSLGADGIGGAGRMAKAVGADLAARGVERFHLVGHSMGGAVATLLALRDPARVASMTLLAPGGFGPEINHRLLERYAEATDGHEMRLALEHMFGWNTSVPDAYLEALIALRRAPGAVDALKAILPTMTTGEGAARAQGMIPRDQLAGLAMPVKVLWGTQDRVLPTRQAHKLPPLFAAHVFEDTGHMLIEEQPEAVVTLIRQSVATGS
jgi:pimeloyl-ACP methyl ester carboxylesterase